jgi:hypothetical protein
VSVISVVVMKVVGVVALIIMIVATAVVMVRILSIAKCSQNSLLMHLAADVRPLRLRHLHHHLAHR